MKATLFRRNEEFDPIAEEQEADLVVVVDGAEGKDGGHLRGQFPLALADAPEVPRGAHVEHDHDRHLPLLGEFLDVRLPGACRDIPVDGPDLVAGRVGSDLLEVHAPALEDALVLAGKRGLHEPAGAQFQPADLAENVPGVVHRWGLGEDGGVPSDPPDQGTGSPSNTRLTISSGVIDSASAS